jgi:hypothetical protein
MGMFLSVWGPHCVIDAEEGVHVGVIVPRGPYQDTVSFSAKKEVESSLSVAV